MQNLERRKMPYLVDPNERNHIVYVPDNYPAEKEYWNNQYKAVPRRSAFPKSLQYQEYENSEKSARKRKPLPILPVIFMILVGLLLFSLLSHLIFQRIVLNSAIITPEMIKAPVNIGTSQLDDATSSFQKPIITRNLVNNFLNDTSHDMPSYVSLS